MMKYFVTIELLLYLAILLTLGGGLIFSRKFRMLFKFNWAKYAIIIAVYALVRLAVWGMMSLESFYMKLTLAQLPMQILLVGVNAAIFVYFYSTVLGRGFSKSGKKSSIRGELVNVKWSDVIGMDNVKAEAREVVELIKDRTRVKKIGGKILRGILMLGPPGCGKTYLAKAVATETGLPFLAMSGSEFVEVFVGVGASRVRELFKKARELAYGNGGCIIFIDELDAIARKRVFSAFGGTEETNSTQNQLLAEMDGLQERELKSGEMAPEQNIIVIGATNSPEDNLDRALLRPGRFDRKLYIDLPTLDDREKLFTYYLGKILHDPAIDVARLARKAVYKSPADIENIIREAALIATREKRDSITLNDISEAMERVDLGLKHKLNITPKEREKTAYHEAGHLVVLYILHPTDDVFKASIIPRRGTLGVVHHQPREEVFTHDKNRLLADIKADLAGYVAEKMKFGTTSSGVAMDFKQAMAIAHNMVWRYGMADKSFLGDYTVIPESQISEKVKEELNAETSKLFQQCLKDVEDLLTKERVILDRFAKELLDKEELDYDEIDAIFKEYGKFGMFKGV
ncbi:MAG: AAA family ATPase [Candidatus Omnitrophica bacterium]|nr:AAA family ATPase [Candidatus Omnitrophota bacterium]